jgi:hypothetical protein
MKNLPNRVSIKEKRLFYTSPIRDQRAWWVLRLENGGDSDLVEYVILNW